jgi:chromosome segregation ATPase
MLVSGAASAAPPPQFKKDPHMSFQFWKAYGQAKGDDANNVALHTLAKYDPKGLTEAQLNLDKDGLSKLADHVAELQTQHDAALQAFNASTALNNQRLHAAENLQAQIATTTDPAKLAELNKSLATLLDLTESAQTEIDEHKQDADVAQRDLVSFQQALTDAGTKIRAEKHTLESAQHDMARATLEKEQAQAAEAAASVRAGLSAPNDSFDIAAKAMADVATKTREQAAAARLKAETLAPVSAETSDPNIVAAMAVAQGKDPAHAMSPGDRLAALRAKAQETSAA